MHRVLVPCLCAGLVALCAAGGSADTVTLHSGKVITGKVTSPESAAVVVVETEAGPLKFMRTAVKEIKKQTEPTPTSKPAETSAASPVKVDEAVRKAFAMAGEQAKKLTEPAEGVALWEAFLRDHAGTPMAELARKELSVWQDRKTKDVVRFGPDWRPREDVAARISKASDLLAKADAEADLKKALPLFAEAAGQNPYLMEIPSHKAKRCLAADDMRNYGVALGEILGIDPNNLMALNNSAVLAAQNKNWAQALQNMAKAASISGSDTIIKNFDEVVFMKALGEEDTYSVVHEGFTPKREKDDNPDNLTPYNWPVRGFTEDEWREIVHTWMASVRVSVDATVATVVAKLHKDNKHANEVLWGSSWITETEYKAKSLIDKPLTGKISVLLHDIKAIDLRGSAVAGNYAKKEREQLYPLVWKLTVPKHACRLVMVDEDGSTELKTFPIADGSLLDEKGAAVERPARRMFP